MATRARSGWSTLSTGASMDSHAEEVKRKIVDLMTGFGEAGTRAPEDILRDFADDGEWWIAGSGPQAGSRTKAQMAAMLTFMPKLAATPLVIEPFGWTVDGDRVAVEASSHMHLKDGKHYANIYHFVFEFRDGKIVKVREYMDTAHVRDVFGG
jgi:ketosteroid isomerase-like protein